MISISRHPINNMNETSNLTTPQSNRSGCIQPIIAFITASWIALISYGKVGLEYLLTSSFMALPSYTWGALAIGQVLLLGLPLLLLAWLWKDTVYRAIYRAWLAPLAFLALNLPSYLLPQSAANARAVYQIGTAILFSTSVWFFYFRRGVRIVSQDNHQHRALSLLTTLTLAGLFTLPWMAMGAAGSLLEMFLQLGSALAFGLAAALAYSMILPPYFPDPSRASPSPYASFRIGFAASVSLLLLASGTTFSFGAMQILLMISLPALGWVLSAGYGFAHLGSATGAPSLSLKAFFPITLLLGLSAAAPMMWFDPDELALIITAMQGEVIFWAGYAASACLALSLASAIIINLAARLQGQKPGRSAQLAGRLMAGLILISLLGALTLKLRSGLHGDGLFVIMDTQADLRSSATVADPGQRRMQVYRSLVEHANASQQQLRASLDRWGVSYTPYYLVNAIQVQGGPLLRWWLNQQPGVSRVLDNPWMRPLPRPLPVNTGQAPAPGQVPWNISMIQADRVWEEFGARGQGILIGNSDSGMQADHPELRDSYRGASGSNDYNWYDPWYHTQRPTDSGGHGTHTLGIVLGNNTGVAPEAQWIGCVNLARNLGNPALYLSCLQFMLAPFPLDGDPFRDGRPELGAQVLNNSWGCPDMEGCDDESLEPAAQALRAAGIFVVVSAGNEGPFCGSLTTPPAIYEAVLSVGAVDSQGSLAIFSSIGQDPAAPPSVIKPDLVAPGVDVLSAFPNSSYAIQSGTSMAGPHVAGVVALIWSANPALIGDIEATERILLSSTTPYTGGLPDCPGADATPSTAVGYGVVNAYRAVQLALQAR